MRDELPRYNRGARLLHWTIAVLVLTNIAIGLLHESLLKGMMPIHKSIGLTVLVLSILRLIWRLTHPAPPLPTDISWIERRLAHANHYVFYGLMLLMPLSGWIMVSSGTRPLDWFGLFPVPKWAVSRESPLAAISGEGHEIMGYLFLALIVIHVAAALRHHFVLKDGVLKRMLY